MVAEKILSNYLPEVKMILFGRKKPSMVSVNLTDRCNQNCIYCELGNENYTTCGELLVKEDLFWIVDQMEMNGIKRLSLCGGEPFLFDDLLNVISYANVKGVRCNITSNGMTIHHLSRTNLEMLAKCKTHVNISIDSYNQDIQKKTRGNHMALENAKKTIHTLIDRKIPHTQLTAISRYNFNDLFDSLQEAYEIGVREVLYQPIIYYSNYPDKKTIVDKRKINVSLSDMELLMSQFRKISEFEKYHRINTNIYRLYPWIRDYIKTAYSNNGSFFFQNMLQKFDCREVNAVIDISYKGGIQPCGMQQAEIAINDGHENDLISLWMKAKLQLASKIAHRDYPEICNSCCHKFSRNMLFSVFKYPWANRKAFMFVMILLAKRMVFKIVKYISV